MKRLLWGIVLGLSFLSVAAIVWLVREQYIMPETETMALFEVTEPLQQLFKSVDGGQHKQGIKVVYFWQEMCPCDEYVKPHFLLMQKKYQKKFPEKVDFYVAPLTQKKQAPQDISLYSLTELPKGMLESVRSSIKATPAVAIWDADGELTYYGPHSLGYICNDETSFVKKVVDRLLSGELFQSMGIVGDGCFCKTAHS